MKELKHDHFKVRYGLAVDAEINAMYEENRWLLDPVLRAIGAVYAKRGKKCPYQRWEFSIDGDVANLECRMMRWVQEGKLSRPVAGDDVAYRKRLGRLDREFIEDDGEMFNNYVFIVDHGVLRDADMFRNEE